MPDAPLTSTVRSGSIALAVREHSPAGPGRPTVLLVHGYPDSQDTWTDLIALLPLDRWHVVTYDVRGAGGSETPAQRTDYRTERLVDDLVAVLDDVLAEGEAVHLVGHDWGSVQLWDAVAAESSDPRLTGRIASYTSVSGPSLDHFGWVLRHPRGRARGVLRQAAASWYVYAFHVPRLPELAWQRATRRLGRGMERREGLPRGHFGPDLARNATNGLNLYRANVFGRARRSRRVRTDVPVLVVHPERDAFLTEVLLDGLDRECSALRVERIDAGHWVIRTHADRVADLVVQHVDTHPAAPGD